MILQSTIEELKSSLQSRLEELEKKSIVLLDSYEVNGIKHYLYITQLFYKNCKKGRIWLSNEFLGTLKNAKYGINKEQIRSKGGKDGIFLLDRTHQPKNEMQRKIFDRFIDKENSALTEYAAELGFSEEKVNGIRVVSHHLRLLGVLFEKDDTFGIILVDFDDTK